MGIMPPSPEHPPRRARGPRRPGRSLAAAAPAVQQRSAAALLLALLSLAGMLALNDAGRGIYVVLYALLAGALALWLATTAIARARRDSTARPRGSVTATVIAAVGVVFSGIMLLAFVMLGKQLSAYSRCLAGANTISTQQACHAQFAHAISREMTAFRATRAG